MTQGWATKEEVITELSNELKTLRQLYSKELLATALLVHASELLADLHPEVVLTQLNLLHQDILQRREVIKAKERRL